VTWAASTSTSITLAVDTPTGVRAAGQQLQVSRWAASCQLLQVHGAGSCLCASHAAIDPDVLLKLLSNLLINPGYRAVLLR